MMVVGGAVVVVVVVGGVVVVVVVDGGAAVVVVLGGGVCLAVVVVVGGFLAVVVVVGAFLVVVVVVVVVAVTVGVVITRETAVVVVAAAGWGLSRVAADVGAVGADLVGALSFAKNLPANVGLAEPAFDFSDLAAVVDLAGAFVAAVVGVVAEAVLGAATLGLDESNLPSDGGVILCTNPT
jgi:hypothetical protein